MAQYHVPPLEELVEKFESLPGIGHKSAQRLAYHVLGMTQEEAVAFAAGAQRQAVKDGSVWTVTIYWVIVLGVAAFVLYKKRAGSKEQKKRVFGDSIYTIMLVLDLVFALSVIYDVSRL